ASSLNPASCSTSYAPRKAARITGQIACSEKRSSAASSQVACAYTGANHARSNHDHVDRAWKIKEIEGNVVSRSYNQGRTSPQMGSNLLTENSRLLFIGNEEEDDISPCRSFWNRHDLKTISASRFLVSIFAVANQNLSHPAVAQILCLLRS